jgi:GH35 family endo-1,4-beta-xylanase
MDSWLDRLDLDKNGLSAVVESGIRKHRKGTFRLVVKGADEAPVAGARVKVKLLAHDFKFGCNAFMAGGFENPEHNQQYDAVFKDLFTQAVVPFFWKDDEPTKGAYRFEKNSPPLYRRPAAEFLLDWCARNEVEPKGHSLVWDGSGLVGWLPRTPEALDPQLALRIREIARRFAGRIRVWDVINEFLSRERRSFRKDYHIHYFKMAEALFPDCHLIANEDTERTWDAFTGDSSRFYLYLQNLLLSGCKVDGIGMQYHLFSKKEVLKDRVATTLNAENLLAFQTFYAGLGRDMHISEISIPSYNEGGLGEEMQARITEAVFKIWFSGERNRSIVWWNLVDGHASCLPPWWDENYFGAGLIRKDFTPKPAFHVIERLIKRDWHTEAEVVTDAVGRASFEGFFGSYQAVIEAGGRRSEVRLNLPRDTVSCPVTLA